MSVLSPLRVRMASKNTPFQHAFDRSAYYPEEEHSNISLSSSTIPLVHPRFEIDTAAAAAFGSEHTHTHTHTEIQYSGMDASPSSQWTFLRLLTHHLLQEIVLAPFPHALPKHLVAPPYQSPIAE